MKRFYHFGRKVRQLKGLIKQYKRTDQAAPVTIIEKIKQLIQQIPNKLLPKAALLSIGLLITTTLNVQAQSPYAFVGHSVFGDEYVGPSFVLPNVLDFGYFARFIDTDNDGDLDVFFATFHHAQYYDPANHQLYYQENQSTENVWLTSPVSVLSGNPNPQDFGFGDLYSFDVANFDNDDDNEIFQIRHGQLNVYINESDEPNEFMFNDTATIDLYNDRSEDHAIIPPLSFSDVDGDGDEDLVSAYLNDDLELETYWMENNGNTETVPFDTIRIVEDFGISAAINSLDIIFDHNAWYNFDLLFDLVDFDDDGDEDLIVQGLFEPDIPVQGPLICYDWDHFNDTAYYVYKVFYFENTGDGSMQINPEGIQLFERDKIERPSTCSSYENDYASCFFPADFDDDGDIDFYETYSNFYDNPGYSPGYSSIKIVVFHENVANEVNHLVGTVFYDANNNGQQELNEMRLDDHLVVLNDGMHQKVKQTDEYGLFQFTTREGDYVLAANIGDAFTTAPIQYELSLDTIPSIIDSLDFAVQIVDPALDLNLYHSNTPLRRGFDTNFDFVIKNEGSLGSPATVKLKPHDYLEFIQSNLTPTQLSDTLIIWELDSIDIFGKTTIEAQFNVSLESTIGDVLSSDVALFPIEGDIDLSRNQYEILNEVLGAIDPNDKLVSPNLSAINLIEFDAGALFDYTIRFQNVGTFEATFITVIDTLDEDLDITTFNMLSASHDYSLEIKDRVARWFFNNIALPDSSTSEEGSHGYVKYHIEPYEGVVDGTEFTNKAHIYFDYEAPVVTNETNNIIHVLVGLQTIELLEFDLFPNPAHRSAVLRFQNNANEMARLEVYSIQGKLVEIKESYSNEIRIDKNELPDGIYTFSLRIGDQLGSGKIIFK